MTYSQGSPGYPPAQPPGSYSATTPSFAKTDEGPSKVPVYLSAAVLVLGLAAYLASFGPTFSISTQFGEVIGEGVAGPILYTVMLAVLAGLLAGVGLLPKGSKFTAAAAVIAVVSALMLVYLLVSKPDGVSIGWALWLVLGLTVLQAIAAVGALLLESGVITPPAPRPKYDPYSQYGPPPGGYYGQQTPQHQQHGPQQTVGQRPGGYPYGGGYQSGPSTGGFSALGPQSGQQQGPPTPPTGFPSFSPPPSGQRDPGPRGPQNPQNPQDQGPKGPGAPGQQQSPSTSPSSGPSSS
jgi:hypothetical protein